MNANTTTRNRRRLSAMLAAAWITMLTAAAASRGEAIDFAREIKPLLAEHCLKCHGPEKQKGGLRFDSRQAALRKGDSGDIAIAPGRAARSAMIRRITSTVDDERMPPKGPALSAKQVELLRKWIDEGAIWPDDRSSQPAGRGELVVTSEDRNHWSYRPLKKVDLPLVQRSDWPRTDIDQFVLAAMETAKPHPLAPSPPIDAHRLIRRVYFDITGLPPTPAEVEAFVKECEEETGQRSGTGARRHEDTKGPPPDNSKLETRNSKLASAYDRLVDRLLASPHYGERWGRHWLDVARYADSNGQEGDQDRPNAYHYRDFVIRALNDDLPFDKFVRWQLGGDELEPDNPLALAATGFLVAGPHTVLENTFLEEERLQNKYNELDDTLSTIGSAMLGLTIGCARCHDHKYDAIPARDYYRMLAAFHTGGRADVPLASREEIKAYREKRDEWDKGRKAMEARLNSWLDQQRELLDPKLRLAKINALPITESEKKLLREKPESSEATALVKKHSKALAINDAEYRKAMSENQQRAHAMLEASLNAIRQREPKGPATALTFRDGSDKPATTWLFQRANFYDRDEPVELGFVSVLTRGKSPRDYWDAARSPRTLPDTTYQRAAMANWMTDVEDGAGALIARVIVNRVWQHHFGQGLVRTVNDFGVQGEQPTHPHLLEWLAHDFVAHGWKLKRLHRMILTSAVYLQDTAFDAGKAKIDPDNRLLWRMRPRRIEAEILRDSMLAVSGTLNLETYGPAFYAPVAPEAIVARNLKSPYPKNAKDSPDTRRRTIYMFQKRIVPFPLLQAFDAPDAQQSCGRRIDTTVAPQALVMLNDQFVRSRAIEFADRLLKEAGDKPASWVQRGFELALSRSPRDSEREAAVAFVNRQLERRTTRDGTAAAPEIRRQALADFCQAMFALNEFIYVD